MDTGVQLLSPSSLVVGGTCLPTQDGCTLTPLLSASLEAQVQTPVQPLLALGSCPASKAPGPSGHALA